MNRSTIVGIVALTLVWSLPRAGADAADVEPGGTFYDDDRNIHERSIEAIAALGTTRGCNPPFNDRFCPDRPVTRGEMAAFLRRALALEPVRGDRFRDDDTSTFESDIEAIAAAGITRGCNPPFNDRFCPQEVVTRGEMAAFLVRALGLTDDGGGDLFVDDDFSVFHHDIDKLGTARITRGCNPPINDRFCPDRAVSRAETATFLARALGLATPPVPSRTTSLSNSNQVEALTFDSAGHLWAVGPGGVVRWDTTNLTAQHFTVDDGLAANGVHDVAAAPDGSVWFATSSGVSRFDGVGWTTWRWPGLEWWYEGLPTYAYVGSVAIAPNGDAWAGFEWLSSVARYDGNRWTFYTQADGLGPGPVTDVAVGPDGVVYVTTESGCCEIETHGGLSVFDGADWRLHESYVDVPDDLYSIAPAADGSAWLGGCDAVHHFDGTTFTTYEVDALPCLGVDIAVAADGDVLLATPLDGIGRFDGTDWTFRESPEGWLTSVVEQDGVVWAGGWTDLWRVENESWTPALRENQPPRDPDDAAPDKNGVLWVATGDAAYSFNGVDWVRHEQLAGFSLSALTVAEAAPNGDLWLGPFSYDGTTWTNHIAGVHFDVGAPAEVIDIAFGEDGIVWFASEYGAVSYLDGTWRSEGGVPQGEAIRSIAAGRGQEGWAVTTDGIYRLGGPRWVRVSDLDGYPVSDATSAANGPDGTAWFSLDDAIAMTDGSSWTVLQGPQVAPVYWSWSMAVDHEGRLWATGHGGIHVYDGIGWTTVNTAEGLASDGGRNISVAPDGTLWITSEAITRYLR